MNASTGYVSTLYGRNTVNDDPTGGHTDGPQSVATFNTLWGIWTTQDGTSYTASTYGGIIRMTNTSGYTKTIAGTLRSGGNSDGQGAAAKFYYPVGLRFQLF